MRETYGSRLHSLGLLSSKARTSILSTKPPGKLLCWSNVPLTFLIPILKMAKATFSPLAHFTLESTTALSLLQKDLVLYFDFYFHIIRPSRGTQKTFLLLTVPDTKGHSCAQKTPPFSVILQLTESGLHKLPPSAPTQAFPTQDPEHFSGSGWTKKPSSFTA